MRETPSIASSAYGTSTVMYNDLSTIGAATGMMSNQGMVNQLAANNLRQADFDMLIARKVLQNEPIQRTEEKNTMADKPKRRLVQVFIADPNENVPLEQTVIYKGEQKLTDSTDQELFFEVDINTLLKAHNEARVKIVDKKVKERTEYLEPAKIRELKMVVVTIAEF